LEDLIDDTPHEDEVTLSQKKRRKKDDEDDEIDDEFDDRLEEEDYDLLEENLGVKLKRVMAQNQNL
jgi:transcription elongation factor SPT6